MDRYQTINYYRTPEQRSLVNWSLDLRYCSVRAAYYFRWSCIYLLILSRLRLNLFMMERSVILYWLVYIGGIYVFLNFVGCFFKYWKLALDNEPVVGTEDQKRLLDGVDESMMDTALDVPNMKPPSFDCKEDDVPFIFRGSPLNRTCDSQIPKKNLCKEPFKILKVESRKPCPEDYLTDPRQLPALIWRAERERQLLEESLTAPKELSSYCTEMSNRVRKTAYELSPPPVSNRPITYEEFGTWHTQRSTSASPQFSSMTDLKLWIKTNIIKRLVTEMDFLNSVLRQRGFVNFEIGSVDRDTFRRTVEAQMVVLPMLPTVLAFLNIAGDHWYIVQRIRELADYESDSYNTGVRLPTDAAIIFHLFCVYLDTQLESSVGYGSPFSSRYVIYREPTQTLKDVLATVENCTGFYFLVTNNEDQRRPRFDYVCGGELNSCPDQRGSPFQVIIEFLTHLRQNQDSTLEGVSLGGGGINIMSVIGEAKKFKPIDPEDMIF